MIARAYAWWEGIPAPIREPIRSFAVSVGLGMIAVVPTLFTAYFFNSEDPNPTWPGFFHLLTSPGAIGGFATAIAGIYRARQAHLATTQTVSTDASVSVPQPPPPEKIVAVETTISTDPKGT